VTEINLIDRLPVMETQRLTLSAFDLKDAKAVFAICSNPRVAEFTSWNPHQSIDDSVRFLRRATVRTSYRTGELRFSWSIRYNAEKELAIGGIDFTQKDESSGRIDYMLAEKYWNLGVMTEAGKLVIGWCFQSIPKLERVLSSGLRKNRASTRVMEKLGMTYRQSYETKWHDKFGDEILEVSEYEIRRDHELSR
jgi:ribosomal-protein-alanine N-acetyltransferase